MQLPQENLTAYLQGVRLELQPKILAKLSEGQPEDFLYALAREYPARGGKYMRPGLLFLSTRLLGGKEEQALPSAMALELFQNFALVHDDIADKSLLRRGKPTLHEAHGVPLALNVGDLLFLMVMDCLAENEKLLGAEKAWGVFQRFQQAFQNTLEGQAFDIGWSKTGEIPNKTQYESMLKLKTGWYSGQTPCEVGAFLAGGKKEVQEELGRFGMLLGVGFQLRDDLLNLGFQAEKALYGKQRGEDIAEGKPTLIMLDLLEKLPPSEKERLVDILAEEPDKTSREDIAWTLEQAHAFGSMLWVEERIKNLGGHAKALLRNFPENPARRLLFELLDYLLLQRKN